MDIHKQFIVACIKGKGIKKRNKEFGMVTEDLLQLKKYLKIKVRTHILIESTGVYWMEADI